MTEPDPQTTAEGMLPTVTSPNTPGIYYIVGDGRAILLDDTVPMEHVASELSELQVRLLAVRIVTWADRVEQWMDAN